MTWCHPEDKNLNEAKKVALKRER
jgi:hypothetical protein